MTAQGGNSSRGRGEASVDSKWALSEEGRGD